jgi:hypothetical protein
MRPAPGRSQSPNRTQELDGGPSPHLSRSYSVLLGRRHCRESILNPEVLTRALTRQREPRQANASWSNFSYFLKLTCTTLHLANHLKPRNFCVITISSRCMPEQNEIAGISRPTNLLESKPCKWLKCTLRTIVIFSVALVEKLITHLSHAAERNRRGNSFSSSTPDQGCL